MSLSNSLLYILCCTSDTDWLEHCRTACMLITCLIGKMAHVLPDGYVVLATNTLYVFLLQFFTVFAEKERNVQRK